MFKKKEKANKARHLSGTIKKKQKDARWTDYGEN